MPVKPPSARNGQRTSPGWPWLRLALLASTRCRRTLRRSERFVDDLHLSLRGRVVRVDLRRLQIRVTEVLLDRPQRHARRGERRGERVAQIVEADLAHAG